MSRHQPAAKHREVRTLGARVSVVYPVKAVGLGQALMVVAGSKVYHMAGLWDRMMEEECKGANEAAFAGKQWIEGHPAAHMKGIDMRALHGGASCCQYTGFPQHLEESVKKREARLEPSEERMTSTIRVGAVGTVKQECKVCQRWLKYTGVTS